MSLSVPEDSDQPELTVTATPVPDPSSLAPSGLTLDVVDGGVALSWTAPQEDSATVTGYEIERAVGSLNFETLVAGTGSAATTYTDATATEAQAIYLYRVAALRGDAKSRPSGMTAVVIPGARTEPQSAKQGGPEPQKQDTDELQKHSTVELRMQDNTDPTENVVDDLPERTSAGPYTLYLEVVYDAAYQPTGVRLNWEAPAWYDHNVTGYRIMRMVGPRVSGTPTVLVEDTMSTATTYTDSTATTTDTTYLYHVRALRGDAVSGRCLRPFITFP